MYKAGLAIKMNCDQQAEYCDQEKKSHRHDDFE